MLVIDTEVYSDYFLLSALDTKTDSVRHFEMFPGRLIDKYAISQIMSSLTVSFNGNHFDLPLIAAALAGVNCQGIKRMADRIIKDDARPSDLLRDADVSLPAWNHVDLIEVAPGKSSLKIYGGRLHAPTIQDLPIEPDASISPAMREQLRSYCENDLRTTALLLDALRDQIKLRAAMSNQYGVDLRSRSDAQIAETIIKQEVAAITGQTYRAPRIGVDSFRYADPGIVAFTQPHLRELFSRILKTPFELGGNGSVVLPRWLAEQRIRVGDAEYQMGIGGLHSCEKSQLVEAGDGLLCDWDVASYYPSIILQQRLAPPAMGDAFLKVYQSIVSRRIAAKRAGDKVTADTLKIAVNGSFGKLGSRYSSLYAPELLIQTTITGQLCLLMLIERMTAAGVRVVSANTDGVVLHCPRELEQTMCDVAWDWMLDTSYELERSDYRMLASRDVNNYLAVKAGGGVKGKGVFASPGLAKNPDMQIVYRAVAEYLAKGVPIERTIRECRDVRQFVTVRRVQGGAIWRGEKLGKAVRFYYATSVASDETINYATNSNKVPKSAGARPLMTLPDTFPDDVDFRPYIVEAEKLLCEVGYRA